MTYTLTMEQYSALEGLAYWVANASRMRERYGNDEPELQVCNKTISSVFDTLDKMNVPFWVQNTVIVFAEDWRRYIGEYLSSYLKTRNIYR